MQAKSFFIIFFFLIGLAMIVNGAMSGQDLTPDTPPAPETVSAFDQTLPVTNTFSSNNYAAIPGGCGATFTVRSGDTLSAIARACGVSLEALIAANPLISNPHLIRPGQIVAVPLAGSAAAQPAAVQQSAPAAVNAQPAAVEQPAAQQLQPTARPNGLVPGGSVHIAVQALPPDTPVTIAIGRVDHIPLNVDRGVTDSQGRLELTAAIPLRAKPGETWMVTIITEEKPIREYTSPPFVIE